MSWSIAHHYYALITSSVELGTEIKFEKTGIGYSLYHVLGQETTAEGRVSSLRSPEARLSNQPALLHPTLRTIEHPRVTPNFPSAYGRTCNSSGCRFPCHYRSQPRAVSSGMGIAISCLGSSGPLLLQCAETGDAEGVREVRAPQCRSVSHIRPIRFADQLGGGEMREAVSLLPWKTAGRGFPRWRAAAVCRTSPEGRVRFCSRLSQNFDTTMKVMQFLACRVGRAACRPGTPFSTCQPVNRPEHVTGRRLQF